MAKVTKSKKKTDQELIVDANEAMNRAIAPYSNFQVGAALECENGEIITGHNIESSSYSLTLCAERVAIFKALSEGHRSFKRIAIVASSGEICTPCGACRQILADFAPKAKIILSNKQGKMKRFQLRELLPHQFDASVLKS
ncbi:MAG: cytidine deaminase [Chloroherpetonaceae bacterium]|nr:cytidine deaminase [Chloroherpetonaceae bacterium]